MDNGNEMRDFLVSRRARITPEQAGLPAYGVNRRVAGLRREEVALLAGVSIDYYTRLERGRAAGASDSVASAAGDSPGGAVTRRWSAAGTTSRSARAPPWPPPMGPNPNEPPMGAR